MSDHIYLQGQRETELIVSLKSQLATEKAAREKAEAALAEANRENAEIAAALKTAIKTPATEKTLEWQYGYATAMREVSQKTIARLTHDSSVVKSTHENNTFSNDPGNFPKRPN